MNIRTIRDMLVDAVKLDRETHDHVGPAPLRAQQILYAHDFADMAGRGKVPGDKKCQLEREDGDPLKTIRRDFWEQYDREPSPAEIARADQTLGWLALVDKPEERRALIGWVNSKAGGKSFRRWCFAIEGISQKTGLKRKDRAMATIQTALGGSMGQHNVLGQEEGLLNTPEINDLSGTIPTGADSGFEGLNSWASLDAFQPFTIHRDVINDNIAISSIPTDQASFSWADNRNKQRRHREARRRKAEQKAAA